MFLTQSGWRVRAPWRLRPLAVGAIGLMIMVLIAIGSWPEALGAEGATGPETAGDAETGVAQGPSAQDVVEKRRTKKPPKSYSNYTIIGASELVTIYPQKFQIRAKVDTGAKSSSVDARILERFTRDGADWVRFQINGDEDATHRIELPIARAVKIRRAGVPREERPAVTMRICLGTVAADVLVNFAERQELIYRMLLGRDFLRGRFLVDAGSRYLTRPSCNEEGAQ